MLGLVGGAPGGGNTARSPLCGGKHRAYAMLQLLVANEEACDVSLDDMEPED